MQKIYSFLKKNIIFPLLLFTTAILNAESFRVGKVHTINISPEGISDGAARLGINEALSIFLPEDRFFFEGLEVKLEIPQELASWPDCVAFTLYNQIKPVPSPSKIDYSGTKFYVRTLPNRLSWIVRIPLKENNLIKSDNYTTKTEVVKETPDNLVFLRFQPIMKGMSSDTLTAKINITVKPILMDKGYLNLNLKDGEQDADVCTVYVDDILVTDSLSKILLKTGIHNISIISEFYRTEVRTVRIEQAKSTNLTVEMKSIEPALLVMAPEGTEVFFDNEPCTSFGTEFKISEGEHKIRFSVGDYEIIRTITAIKGKTYTANFAIDLQITEE